MGIRLIGPNPVDVADAIRAGRLEAGLVVLPVGDDGLDLEPIMRDEVLYNNRGRDAGGAADRRRGAR